MSAPYWARFAPYRIAACGLTVQIYIKIARLAQEDKQKNSAGNEFSAF